MPHIPKESQQRRFSAIVSNLFDDNRPHTAATETYTYDGFGKRVLIGVPSASTQDIFDPASGRLLVENNAGAQPQRTYVYLNGMPIALVSGFSSINYVLSDQLGQPQKLVGGRRRYQRERLSTRRRRNRRYIRARRMDKPLRLRR